MKKLLIIIALCLSVLNISFADVTIEIMNLSQKTMRVTYILEETLENSKDTTLPSNGFEFASGSIKVISVRELNTEQPLKYEIVKKNNLEAVKIYYPNPLPKGGNYRIECIVEAQSAFINKTADGLYEFSYFTGNDAYFILPKDHAVVYSNLPIILYDKNGQIVVLVKEDEYFPHKIVLKTKSYAD